jgi:hemerythrin-like domain-containing protein
MEKKPIKRNKYIIQLSKDHHHTLLFCWKIRTGVKFKVETGRIKNYVQYFWQTHIEPHFNEEETILFAPVKDNAVQKALGEHDDIRQQINTIITSKNIQVEQLEHLANTIESHVRYEERELFAHLENVLTENQLKQIGKALQRTNAAVCHDEFADEFWIKK